MYKGGKQKRPPEKDLRLRSVYVDKTLSTEYFLPIMRLFFGRKCESFHIIALKAI